MFSQGKNVIKSYNLSNYQIFPYSKGTTGVFRARVIDITDSRIVLNKSDLTLLKEDSEYSRDSFNTDTVIQVEHKDIAIGDKIALQLEAEFKFDSTNYSLSFGEGDDLVEHNLYKNAAFDISEALKDIDLKKNRAVIHSTFL